MSYASATFPAKGSSPQVKELIDEEDNRQVKRLYISNIPFIFGEWHLTQIFEKYGKVTEAMVVTNEKGSKGFGFVTLESAEEANAAMAAIDGQIFNGRRVEVKKAHRHNRSVRPLASVTVPPPPSSPSSLPLPLYQGTAPFSLQNTISYQQLLANAANNLLLGGLQTGMMGNANPAYVQALLSSSLLGGGIFPFLPYSALLDPSALPPMEPATTTTYSPSIPSLTGTYPLLSLPAPSSRKRSATHPLPLPEYKLPRML